MIETLRIANLAIVERAEIEFAAGLNVVTGETGAGKSIVLGALALLAGSRAGADAVREGAEEAVVEAVFRTGRLPDLEAALRERGLEPEEGVLVVSRSVSRAGRSRASVAGRLVPVATLAELFAGRLEISSQHESQRLRRPESHAWLLDAFGGLLALRARVGEGFAALRAAQAERAALEADAEERARRHDFARFQLGEIEAAGLSPGELAALGAEHARLAHAEELRAAATAAAAAVAGDGLAGEPPGAADLVDTAARALAPALAIDATLAPLAERLRAAHAEMVDAARDLERYADAIEVDPARRRAVEERLAELERLRRKYGRSEAEILARRDVLAAELSGLSGSDERARELAAREAALRDALAADAAALSAGRAEAGRRLAAEVESALAGLEMAGARVEVALEAQARGDLPCGPAGAETVEFRLSANPGEAPRPLRKVASGGELSRVFLALKNVLRASEAGMVLVFDEVDAGIGGRTAERVGAALAELAADHQVLCITHLPQVAATAARHLRVAKRVARSGRSVTEVTALDADARVEELARMAGGATVTDATRRHARELLRAGARARTPAPPAR